MTQFVNQFSEIGKLNKVLLHRPGAEVARIMPDYLAEMLAEDTPHLPTAQKEHDFFAQTLRNHGVNVLYLEDLFAQSVTSEDIRLTFIEDFLAQTPIKGASMVDAVREYLLPLNARELFEATMRGIVRSDLMNVSPLPIPLAVSDAYPFVTDPMPNAYFTRDVAISIGNGMVISSMSMPSRRRETLYVRYIHDFHPDYMHSEVPLWYDYNLNYGIEGGDVLVLSSKTLAIGCGERTSIAAVECVANRIFACGYERILLFNNPKSRKFMHLDVLCTMVDYDKFLVNPVISEKQFEVYELTGKPGALNISLTTEPVDTLFARMLKLPAVQFIEVGGGDPIAAAREHWNMGSNSLTLSPGNIVTYDRNEITNELLVKAGIRVNTVPGSELSRGRGGPRCMSMPINREKI